MWRWTRRLFIGVLLVGLLAVGAVAGAIWHFGRDLPDLAHLHDYQPPQVTRVLDRDGEVLGESWQERRTVVPLERVPRVLVLSVLAAEDADFYRHRGLDYPGLIRAVGRGVLSGGHFRGTSTITQQVIKNLLLSPERTLDRKIRELLLARQLEQEFTKDEILELYLNHVNFGHGRYGVQEAAQFYFGKNVEDLSLAEASLIAGIPQSPTHLSPRRHLEAAQRRQAFVLSQLEQKRAEYWPDLALEEIEEARAATVTIIELPERDHPAREVVSAARRLLREQVGREAARRGGYTIHTTLDRSLQTAARAALRGGLEAIDERQRLRLPLSAPRRARPLAEVETLRVGGTYDARVTGYDADEEHVLIDVGGHPAYVRLSDLSRWNPDALPIDEVAAEGARVRASIQSLPAEGETLARAQLELGPQGAVVLIDPRTRDVLAMVGGYEEGPGFDRATQAVRQPGSTFKPFVYGLGIRSRDFTPATLVLDAPGVYDNWLPSNYERSFRGEIRLREALAASINQVAVRVIETVEPAEVVGLAQELGITSELDPTLALALGASDVRPIEMVNAYTSFAAGGRWAPYRIITRIEGPDGRDVALPTPEPPRDVMTPAEAYVLTSMLTSVVDHGTARRARVLRRPAAGKTGTSNEVRDAWFVGYTADLVAGVWVGYDDRRPLGRRESGGRSALPVWIELMQSAHEGRPRTDFAMPSGVVRVQIDPASGRLAYEGQEDAIDEVFLEGTEPTEVATPPDVLDPDSFLMEELGGGLDAGGPEPGAADTSGATDEATP